MKKTVLFVAAAFALAAVCVLPVGAQNNRAAAATTHVMPNALAGLPASDAVVSVDVQRLFREALPRIFANDAAKLAEINADVEEFKRRTGLDPRTFERVAVGARFVDLPSGAVKVEMVALARGTFNAAALMAAGRIAAQDKYQQEQYKGKTINVFSLDKQVKFLNLHWTDLAAVVLDDHTLAFGKLERVRAAIDAQGGGARVARDVVALAERDPAALISMGGNIPAALTGRLDFLGPELSRSIASVRQFYGSLGATSAGFQLLTVFRTGSAADAHNLSDTVAGLKQLAPFAISRMKGDKAKQTQQLVDATRVTTEDNDVQIRLDLADANVVALLRVF